MTQLRIMTEIFDAIHKVAVERRVAFDNSQYVKFVDNEIDQWRRIHSFMDDATVQQYFEWRVKDDLRKKYGALAQPKPTAKQF